MGLTDDNDIEAPPTNDDAGWYRYGTRPGNEGSAVIAGHFGLRGDAVLVNSVRSKRMTGYSLMTCADSNLNLL